MGIAVFTAETTLVNFGVKSGEEEVLQHGAVVGIAVGRVVFFQQLGCPCLNE